MWSVPAGYGKSRIIIAAIVALSFANPDFKFVVVYNHQELMDEDSGLLKRMGTQLANRNVSFKVASDNSILAIEDPNQVTIIDEVDNVLIDN